MSSSSVQYQGVDALVIRAKTLFEETFGTSASSDEGTTAESTLRLRCAAAPGRVNLIGEHTDYTGGFVLPMAIGYSTVCYGRGGIVPSSSPLAYKCRVVSTSVSSKLTGSPFVVSFSSSPTEMSRVANSGDDDDGRPSSSWANYVAGTVAQYVPDVPPNRALTFDVAVAGDVPLGSGLSSSASLEVSVARFVECLLADCDDDDDGVDLAFSSSERVGKERSKDPENEEKSGHDDDDDKKDKELRRLASIERAKIIERALRCQKAENTWCDSPCGIMDQFVSSAARTNCAIFIDCRVPDYECVPMGGKEEKGEEDAVAVVICNSNVQHSIAGGEYPVRVSQCQDATVALRRINPSIAILRDASLDDVDKAKGMMDDVTYRRARHVVTENGRTIQAKEALNSGDWEKMGRLMNESHESMKSDYEVSCEEIDVLVSLAQSCPGVYGSRLTGGGFGGCTVTLVNKDCVPSLIETLKDGYMEKLGKECMCLETTASDGAREIVL